MKKQTVDTIRFETPLGTMLAGATKHGICLLQFTDGKHTDLKIRQLSAVFDVDIAENHDSLQNAENPENIQNRPPENPHLATLMEQIDQYFAGERRDFDIPLDPIGTEFQKRVWQILRQIPYGGTMSYGRQAELLGSAAAVRAVAAANGKNKISIILPCHRVVGSDGTLTGYAGGLWRKKWLLDFEAGAMPVDA